MIRLKGLLHVSHCFGAGPGSQSHDGTLPEIRGSIGIDHHHGRIYMRFELHDLGLHHGVYQHGIDLFGAQVIMLVLVDRYGDMLFWPWYPLSLSGYSPLRYSDWRW